jgi:adenine-specific DNA-methyltransferase
MNLSLFEDDVFDAPLTEGVKYAGSKRKLLPHILNLASKTGARTVLDGFSGTTRVSQAFAKSGLSVISSDLSAWSKTFAECYLLNNKPANYYNPLLEHLNNLKGYDGWFTENYGGDASSKFAVGRDGNKKPWQFKNTRRLDAIRDEIDKMGVSPIERSVLITSLILALDSVDNTLGHYASYLNEWSKRSYNDLRLKIPLLNAFGSKHSVVSGDIFDTIKDTRVDLAYLDPPYGSNNEKMPPSRVRYSAYYHIWTTICRADKPEIFGKANRRSDTSDLISSSVFENFRKDEDGKFVAVEAIRRLLLEVDSDYVILSYSSGGRATAEELSECINEVGTASDVIKIDYRKNVMASMKWTSEWTRDAEEVNKEFLFLVKKK